MHKPHKKLVRWQKSMDLVVLIYAVTQKFPQHEICALTSQLRRAAVSVPANISEGAACVQATNLADECSALTFGLRKSLHS